MATKKPTKKPTAKPAAKPTTKPTKKATRYGLMRDDGSWCFEPRFEGMGHYGEGLIAIRVGERWGFADQEGEVVIEPAYDRVFNFSGGGAAVHQDGRWTNIDRDGRELDGWRGTPSEGRVRFCHGGRSSDFDWEGSGGLFGFLDEHGGEVIAPRYELADDFSLGLAMVELEATGSGFRYAYLGLDGAVVIPSFDAWAARRFADDGWARIQRLDHTWAFIDRMGKVVLETEYREVSPFEEDRAVVRKVQEGPSGHIDRGGRVVTELVYEQASPFSRGLAAVRSKDGGGSWGYVDLEGELAIEPRFRAAKPFAAGVAPVAVPHAQYWSTTVWGLIDRRGSWVVEPELSFISDFANGVARFQRGDSWGLFDEQGRVIADGYAAIEAGSPLAVNRGGKRGKKQGVAGGKWGFIDTTGKEVVPPTLEAVAGAFRQGRVGAARKVAVQGG